ncbi:hypothetical protein LEP1GSC161_1481 [Leptospira santarosai str. CBC1416]|uniref:Uncharacterized protein n=4 Tax=Leptospira santarosai TaxID=28183 RepID=M6V3J7_9LEPT|nr:hypothetical protein LEP1GSC179_3312 [Leptospira santarosai str. MOR084]EKO78816.1 hypothetical protein LEP1GSC068_2574 [Leptospira sp. Fiocruz LV3954]EKR90973.1 hypothetical protein LEP1GSC163_3937 [Leptospira santarosai str. CBC379]EMI64728.1 hypothetical protein LEP1GSC076_3269 [Leptospira sp. Fiocruz LV4135]EMM86280.1 hypothetical protein LEP1GSC039_2034 [Leptospira santarosai str. 2000027870]EMN19590.1 hypothetical protein LEP1GSC063_1582 [Leptospira santarosai serovar Arenal str. MAVJ
MFESADNFIRHKGSILKNDSYRSNLHSTFKKCRNFQRR